MTVARILKNKGNTDVVTIGPDATIADASALLGERRIGSVVVTADGSHPDGILSERDIVRALGTRGAAILDLPVTELMTSELQTARPEDLANEALARMTEGRFRHMPVLEDGVLVGLITLGDVVKARLEEAEADRAAMVGMVQGSVA